MSRSSKIIYFYVSLIFFIFFDEYFSMLILQEGHNLVQNPIVNFVFVQNQGAAFNILDGFRIFLIIFSSIAVTGIIFFVMKNILKISMSAILFSSILTAGIFCNMLERALLGYVRDYIKLNFINFPVFNISDIFINIGVFALVLIIIKNNFVKNNEDNN